MLLSCSAETCAEITMVSILSCQGSSISYLFAESYSLLLPDASLERPDEVTTSQAGKRD